VYLFNDADHGRIVHLAEVGVGPEEETVTLRFLESGDEARDIYRAVGGDLAQLDALLADGTETKKQRRTRSAKSRRPRS
jgi:ribosomal protein S28E/S33